MGKLIVSAAAAGLAGLALLVSAGPSSAGAVNCNTKPTSGKLKGLVVITSARSMSCAQALADVKTATSFPTTFVTKGDFRCTRQAAKVHAHSQWRCVNGAKAYRFETTP